LAREHTDRLDRYDRLAGPPLISSTFMSPSSRSALPRPTRTSTRRGGRSHRPLMPRTGSLSAVLGAELHRTSVSFGRTTQNLRPSGSARTVQDSAPVCPMSTRRPERQKAVNLLIAAPGAAGRVKMHAVLDRLGLGDRHEAHADGRVLVGPDDDLVLPLGRTFQLSACVQNRARPGRS
jgi:hypothetical protein